jgi:acetyl esterase/lipase
MILVALSMMAAFLLTAASAQESNGSKPEHPVTPAGTPKVINIWPGVAPGSEQWKQKETTIRFGPMQSIVNVTTPTLTAYQPDPSKVTGTAVIIAPGGGFLSLGSERDVAEWLAARGIAAFDLKYRTAQLEGENEAQLGQAGRTRFGAQLANHALIAEDGKYGIADGIQAIKVLREHAAELGISPDRIVFMGFSAGGMITEYTAVNPDASARPNYASRNLLNGYPRCRIRSTAPDKSTKEKIRHENKTFNHRVHGDLSIHLPVSSTDGRFGFPER